MRRSKEILARAEETQMSRQSLQRHFPTAIWLLGHVKTELQSLVVDFKKSFPRETALSPLVLTARRSPA